jgi:hypothetical protein
MILLPSSPNCSNTFVGCSTFFYFLVESIIGLVVFGLGVLLFVVMSILFKIIDVKNKASPKQNRKYLDLKER